MNNLYLAHYGVIGQKWGVRRYQNKDGTLTSLGKNHYSKDEIKSDNKTAMAKGRIATVAGRKMYYANKLNKRNQKKLNDATDENRAKLSRNAEVSSKIANDSEQEYNAALKDAMAHADSLVKKYGKTNVSDIKYKTLPDGSKVVNEKIYTGKQKALGVLTFIVATLPLGTAWLYPLVPMPASVKGAASVGVQYFKGTRIKRGENK